MVDTLLHAFQDPAVPTEFLLRGRAIPIADGELRAQAVAAWSFNPGDEYPLFELDIAHALLRERPTADDWPRTYSSWRAEAGGGGGAGPAMSYEGDHGEVSGIYRPDSRWTELHGPTGDTLFVAPGSVTRRQFGLFRRDITPRGGGADPHFHRTFSESFYVISGTVRLYDGKEWVEAKAGDFLYVPKGGIHGFSNDADEPASLLILFAPGYARERYFLALDEMRLAGTKLTDTERTAFLASHDQYMVQ